MTEIELAALGDALEAAVVEQVRTVSRGKVRTLVVAFAALAIVIPAAAVAAAQLFSNVEARSMPAGALILAGTEPTCTTVRTDVEYHCALTHAPANAVDAGLIKGTVYETVNAEQKVNGGCRALNDAGTEWECYIGEEAVRQQIISQGFLGQTQTTPAVG